MIRTLSLVLAAGMVLLGVACFSERSTALSGAGATECRLPVGQDVPGATLVIVRDFSFTPATVTVPAGSAVVWLNCDAPGAPGHTSTGDQGGWNSPILATGEAFVHRFDQAGTFAYHCEPHPFMTGTVIIAP